eukprot:scaffold38892_cov32-Tisochrysis_lutea.AAC.1
MVIQAVVHCGRVRFIFSAFLEGGAQAPLGLLEGEEFVRRTLGPIENVVSDGAVAPLLLLELVGHRVAGFFEVVHDVGK